MLSVLQYFPGQVVTVFLETVDGYGARTDEQGVIDGYSVPVVHRVIDPNLDGLAGYPNNMTKYDTGLYYFQFTLPSGAAAVGSYLVDIEYYNPANGVLTNQAYQVVVTAPYGLFTARVSI
jgi:hypothetical protein